MRSSESQGELASALKAFSDKRSRARTPLLAGDGDALEALKKIRKELLGVGITYAQDVHTGERGKIGTSTRLMHTSGEWMESETFFMPGAGGARRVSKLTASLSLLGIVGLLTVENAELIKEGIAGE